MATLDHPAEADHHDHGHHHHPDLAHHFDTLEQQFDAGKLGMWLFLVTEVLFFSGLFVFYTLFRTFHPALFDWGHHQLEMHWGLINTIVLIFSSVTMAWAVRCAQLNQRAGLIILLSLTILCGFAFCGVKYIEYSSKISKGMLWAGNFDEEKLRAYEEKKRKQKAKAQEEEAAHEVKDPVADDPEAEALTPELTDEGYEPLATAAVALSPDEVPKPKKRLGKGDPAPPNAGVFFSIYFTMTGLHAFHVIVGIGVLIWILVRSIRGDFSSEYYEPVDLVGLYWHLVDLIWIFLFPMLYLID